VTLADLFRVLSAIQGDLAKMATRLEVIDTVSKTADQQRADHETRIRALEAFRWKLAGIAIVVGILAGFVTAWASSRGH
jgi:hypothetical protein